MPDEAFAPRSLPISFAMIRGANIPRQGQLPSPDGMPMIQTHSRARSFDGAARFAAVVLVLSMIFPAAAHLIGRGGDDKCGPMNVRFMPGH